MCDIKPGDEVAPMPIATGAGAKLSRGCGSTYTVERVFPYKDQMGVVLVGEDSGHPTKGYDAAYFRKVQKRKDSLTLESFLTIKPGFEEPRRVVPAKPKKVKA